MLDRLAPYGFVLLWSSSFIAARVGLRHISPLLFITARLGLCALVLVTAMFVLRRRWRVLRGLWFHCAVAGILIHAVMLSTAHVALTRVPAAPIALIQTINPLLTALLAWPVLGERLTARQWLGLFLGAAGVLLIVGLAAAKSRADAAPLLLTAVGVVALCLGTLYFGRFCRGVPLLEGVTVQFVAAFIANAIATPIFENPWTDLSLAAGAATAWNAFAVSLGGMALYMLMLARGTAARATANFYLTPGTAAVMAWAILGEPLALMTVIGIVVSSAGCWMVRRR